MRIQDLIDTEKLTAKQKNHLNELALCTHSAVKLQEEAKNGKPFGELDVNLGLTLSLVQRLKDDDDTLESMPEEARMFCLLTMLEIAKTLNGLVPQRVMDTFTKKAAKKQASKKLMGMVRKLQGQMDLVKGLNSDSCLDKLRRERIHAAVNTTVEIGNYIGGFEEGELNAIAVEEANQAVLTMSEEVESLGFKDLLDGHR